MEGVDLYKTPYLHPKLNDHDIIVSKELGYGYCIGALGGFAYHMRPQPESPATVMKSRLQGNFGSFAAEYPSMAQLKAAIKSSPLAAAVSTKLRARFGNAITKAPLVGIQVGGWVALRAYIEYKIAGYRGKVDSDNSFVSGAVVGGLAAAYYRLTIIASALMLGTAVGTFDCACDRWYFKNNGRSQKSPIQLH